MQKRGIKTNSNLMNLIVNSTGPFLARYGPKGQKCLMKMKLGAWTNSDKFSLMVTLICLVLDRKYSFWANLPEKIKTVFLS